MLSERNKGADDPRDAGCLCGGCGRRYRTDLMLPDDLWGRVTPDGIELLCPVCIGQRLEAIDGFHAYQLATPAEPPKVSGEVGEIVEALREHVRYEYMPAAARTAMDQAADALLSQARLLEERTRERDELRLAICGGEDAPGYNASLSHETILGVLADNYRSWKRDSELAWDGQTASSWKARAEAAERLLEEVVGALENIKAHCTISSVEFVSQGPAFALAKARRAVEMASEALTKARAHSEGEKRGGASRGSGNDLCADGALPTLTADAVSPWIDGRRFSQSAGDRWRHLKRGSTYTRPFGAAEAMLQTAEPIEDGAVLTIYIGEDGMIFARPTHEFHDGRFAPLPASAADAVSPEGE